MKRKQYLDDKTEKLDDIDRLFQMAEQSDPAPGRAFQDTLEQLRQGLSKTGGVGEMEEKPNSQRNHWRTLAITGLGAAAILAVGFMAISALATPPAPPPPSIVSLPTVPADVAAPLPTIPVPNVPATWQVIVYPDTETVGATTVAATTSNPPIAIPPQQTIPITVQEIPPAATPTPSSPVRINPPTVNTPISRPSKPIAVGPATVNTPISRPSKPIAVGPVGAFITGKVISFDKDSGLIKVNSNGTTRTIKLLPTTAITKQGVAAKSTEIVAGMTISATGSFNAQAQMEALTVTLNETSPSGNPGFPNEQG